MEKTKEEVKKNYSLKAEHIEKTTEDDAEDEITVIVMPEIAERKDAVAAARAMQNNGYETEVVETKTTVKIIDIS